MKIAIISDTHDNVANTKKIVDWLEKEKITTVIHCGDVSSPDTLKEGCKDFSGKVYLVLGNTDFKEPKDYEVSPNFKVFAEFGKIESHKIAFVHFPKEAKKLAKTGKYNLVFYGHLHFPWESKVGLPAGGSCRIVNPGNVAGLYFKPSFAVYDENEDKLELKTLEDLK